MAFAGTVLLAIHPDCMDGQILLNRNGGQIEVTMPKPNESHIILASNMPSGGRVAVAAPEVTEVGLDELIRGEASDE